MIGRFGGSSSFVEAHDGVPTLLDVAGVDGQRAWAVGEDGAVVQIVGRKPTVRQFSSDLALRGVAVSQDVGWAVGDGGAMVRLGDASGTVFLPAAIRSDVSTLRGLGLLGFARR